MAKGPQYTDATDAIGLLRVATWFGPACFIMLSGLWFFMLKQGWISPGMFVVLLVKTMFADGDIALPPTYPRQDVLIVQGKYAEAADWFRDHLRIEPGDHEARLQLAHLLEMHLQGFDEAERLYLEIRGAEPPASAREQMRATNGLIDVYRKTGRTGRLKVELARFVERYRGSPLAAGAARELKELKEIDSTSESPRSPR